MNVPRFSAISKKNQNKSNSTSKICIKLSTIDGYNTPYNEYTKLDLMYINKERILVEEVTIMIFQIMDRWAEIVQ